MLAVIVAEPAGDRSGHSARADGGDRGSVGRPRDLAGHILICRGCLPWRKLVPVAPNWAVWPAASDWADGVIVMVATSCPYGPQTDENRDG